MTTHPELESTFPFISININNGQIFLIHIHTQRHSTININTLIYISYILYISKMNNVIVDCSCYNNNYCEDKNEKMTHSMRRYHY